MCSIYVFVRIVLSLCVCECFGKSRVRKLTVEELIVVVQHSPSLGKRPFINPATSRGGVEHTGYSMFMVAQHVLCHSFYAT